MLAKFTFVMYALLMTAILSNDIFSLNALDAVYRNADETTIVLAGCL